MTTPRKRTGLRIPYEQNTKLTLLAQKMGISKNAVILQAIREFLKENEQYPSKQEASR